MQPEDGEERALSIIEEMRSVIVAYSGGVDSSLVCSLARDALDDRAMAVIGVMPMTPPESLAEARATAAHMKIPMREIEISLFENGEFMSNSPDRCYYCKMALFSAIGELAEMDGFECVADGTNADDESDRRPGVRAVRELGIRSPLREAGLSKAEVREISRRRGLPTWDRPQGACLATRIPYGMAITGELVELIARAERAIRGRGFKMVRVRVHDDTARIEIDISDIERLIRDRLWITQELKKMGFSYVALDLEGYRSGSMDEVLR